MYSSTLSLTAALDGGGWLAPRLRPLDLRERDPVPLYRRFGGPQGRSGRVRKISPPPGFVSRTVRSVASRYIDFAFTR